MLDPYLIVVLVYLGVGVVVFCRMVEHELWSLEWLMGLVVLVWPAILLLWAVGWRLALRPLNGETSSEASTMVGKHGVTLSELRPSGKVKVAGRTYCARADEYIARGVRVVVVAFGAFELRVRAESTVPGGEADDQRQLSQ